MMRESVILLLCLLNLYQCAIDLNPEPTDGISEKILVKYEGTMDEVKSYASSLGLELKTKVFKNWYVLTIPKPRDLSDPFVPYRVPDIDIDMEMEKRKDKKVKFIQQEKFIRRVKRSLIINDEKWSEQWHLQPEHIPSMNVYEAWEKGYTGKGVQIMIIDDGVDVDHPDLIANYNASLSYDLLEDTEDASHKNLTEEGHGTNCAGIISSAKDTNCVIGIAYESVFSAVRLISVIDYTFSDEAMALTHQFEHVDIYSNSWGPDDEGFYMSLLADVIEEALELTIKEGRGGKGIIYTWAAGNGGNIDNCNADPYSSSMYTISVAAIDYTGSQTYYSEPCTSILVATFSGDGNHYDITTTGPNATCVDDFLGTSAATPIASGIIALTLQANPNLTWRDIQHMIVEYSNFSALQHKQDSFDAYEYYTNGAGKQVSIWSGFGLMNANAMVENAPNWSTVPPRISCNSGSIFVNRFSDDQVEATYTISDCHIKYTEHVEVRVFYNTSFRGYVQLYLLSPMETESLLLTARLEDSSAEETEHIFMSVHNWGEDPNGEWKLTVYGVYQNIDMHLFDWKLEIFGTATDPLMGIPAVGTYGSPCTDSTSCILDNGGCLVNNDVIGDNICISCTNGFHFNGEFCERDCPPLDFVIGGYILMSNDSNSLVASYHCYSVYGMDVVDGDAVRTCGSDGIWTGQEPICDYIVCGNLTDPVNGGVDYWDNIPDSIATYWCDEGFVLVNGDTQRVCLETREWNGTEPICARDCGSLSSPVNGTVTLTSTFEGSIATYTCKRGFSIISGSHLRKCNPDGLWTGQQPVCEIDCGLLAPPGNGSVSFTSTTLLSEAVYQCNSGYSLASGNKIRTCAPNGIWSGAKPSCVYEEPIESKKDSVIFLAVIIGCSVGGAILLAIVLTFMVVHYKRSKRSK